MGSDLVGTEGEGGTAIIIAFRVPKLLASLRELHRLLAHELLDALKLLQLLATFCPFSIASIESCAMNARTNNCIMSALCLEPTLTFSDLL